MNKKTRYFMAGSAAVLVAGLCTGLIAYYGGGFPKLSASRTGPAELSYIPADATVVAYANVGEVMASQLRQKMKQVMPGERGQQEFLEHTGIDIERDIQYIVAAVTSAAWSRNTRESVLSRCPTKGVSGLRPSGLIQTKKSGRAFTGITMDRIV
jgi:hypothetical protein